MNKISLITFNDLLDNIKKNNITIDSLLLKKAYNKAQLAHNGVFRRTGEEYIYHPLFVANTLVSWKLDGNTIISAILHDTVEDSDITIDEIKKEFGDDIANLVDGVTKISHLTEIQDDQYQNFENVRKFLIASSEDIRIIILKLADRLHNISTIGVFPKTKRESYAKETMNIYSPLAEYLGMNAIKANLDDICFSILQQKEYNDIKSFLDSDKDFEILSGKFISSIKKELDNNHIHYEIFGRKKSIYSIYKKIKHINGYFDKSFISKLNDLIAFTILVDSIEYCYKTLGIIHTLFQYISSEFDDYIARPKPNGFKTLQTSVYTFDNRVTEIQIKTYEMHEYNEYGPASHIAYKLSENSSSNLANKFLWIKNLVLWKNNNNNESIIDLFKDRIYVLTPKGLVKELEVDSTPIDFAYMIHTDIGNSMIGAKVNGKMVSLDYKLKTGDVVEILVSNNKFLAHPDWIKIARMSSVRQKIRKFIKNREEEDNKKNIKDVKPESRETLYHKLKIPKKDKASLEINVTVDGATNIPTKFAKCCNPKPFDNIAGVISLNNIIMIHNTSCNDLGKISKEKLINVKWNKDNLSKSLYFSCKLLLEGIVTSDNIDKIIEQIALLNLKILNISSEIIDDKFNIFLNIDLLNNKSLSDIIKNLKSIDEVDIVKRV